MGTVLPRLPRSLGKLPGSLSRVGAPGLRPLLDADFSSPRTQLLPETAEALATALGGSS